MDQICRQQQVLLCWNANEAPPTPETDPTLISCQNGTLLNTIDLSNIDFNNVSSTLLASAIIFGLIGWLFFISVLIGLMYKGTRRSLSLTDTDMEEKQPIIANRF